MILDMDKFATQNASPFQFHSWPFYFFELIVLFHLKRGVSNDVHCEKEVFYN
jgi:hypothetical protein